MPVLPMMAAVNLVAVSATDTMASIWPPLSTNTEWASC